MPDHLEGGCFCGALRYRVEGEPDDAGYCHCRMCQRAAGAPVLAWGSWPSARFRWLRGDPAVLTDYGHLIETFAVGEMLKQVSWWDAPIAVGHFRTASADEVDLVLERDDGDVIAFEIKSGTRVHAEDLRGIRALRSRLGNRLQAAVVLYAGQFSYTHDDGTMVVPLDALWSNGVGA